jgi:hypothetical protein
MKVPCHARRAGARRPSQTVSHAGTARGSLRDRKRLARLYSEHPDMSERKFLRDLILMRT